jgi:hypothetical protein
VELLFLKTIGAGWIMGPSMPLTVIGSTMQSFQNGVILIGGTGQVFCILRIFAFAFFIIRWHYPVYSGKSKGLFYSVFSILFLQIVS